MKKGILAIVLAAICTMGLSGCDRVEPGYVGIKVNKLGEDKGIGEVVGVGRQWTGINTELYVFPTFKQMKTYDEPFTFQMSDGTAIGHKIGVAYLVNRDKVTTVFQTYRKGVDDITDTDLRQKIADSLNRLASRMTTDAFIDGGKAALLDNALKDIQKEMTPVGIEVLSLSWVGNLTTQTLSLNPSMPRLPRTRKLSSASRRSSNVKLKQTCYANKRKGKLMLFVNVLKQKLMRSNCAVKRYART